MCKEVCKVVVLLNKPIAFLTFLLLSPSSLLKLPNIARRETPIFFFEGMGGCI